MRRRSNFIKFVFVVTLLSPLLLRSQFKNNGVKKEKEFQKELPALLVSTGAVLKGGTLEQCLSREGLKSEEIRSILSSLRPLFNLQRVHAGDPYEVYRSTSGLFVKFQFWEGPVNYYTVVQSTTGIHAEKKETLAQDLEMGLVGTIQSSLWEAMAKQGLSPEMIIKFTDIFAWQIDFLTEPRVGDKFKLIWKRKQSNRGFIDGEIIAALYNGKETGKLLATRFKGDFYLPDGKSVQRQFLRAPLKFSRISSYFSNHRFHPILRIYRPHHGIDYVAARGTPVSSVGDGEVVFKGWNGGTGNMVKIRHRNSSYSSIYGHLSRYAAAIKVGSTVRQGQLIGYVGSTGLSTGPHLHFAVEKNGTMINFLRLDLPSATVLEGPTFNEFDNLRKRAEPRLEGLVTQGDKPIVLKESGLLSASQSAKSTF